MTCKYKGKEYSDGAEVRMAGGLFQCRGDEWTYVGQCGDSEVGYIPTLRLVTHYINNSENEAQAFKANPTQYMKEKLSIAGFADDVLNAIHAHYSDNGKLIPEDTDIDLANRSGLYEFSGDGSIAYKDGNEISVKAACERCYGICIVLKL